MTAPRLAEPALAAPLDEGAVKPFIVGMVDRTPHQDDVSVSVVIVAYNAGQALLSCLESLAVQSEPDFEIVLVDNGGNEAVLDKILSQPVRYFRLDRNHRPSLARNVGIVKARAEVVCFLDDDAQAHEGFVAAYRTALQDRATLGVRGRILPKTDTIYNYLAMHYDLGEAEVSSYIDVEGNCAFRRQVLLEVGGFHPQLFGGEGVELSYRIAKKWGNSCRLLYHPSAIIYHDFSTGLRKLVTKTVRGAKMSALREQTDPEIRDFVASFHPLPQGARLRPDGWSPRIRLGLLRRLERQGKALCEAWYRRKARHSA